MFLLCNSYESSPREDSNDGHNEGFGSGKYEQFKYALPLQLKKYCRDWYVMLYGFGQPIVPSKALWFYGLNI